MQRRSSIHISSLIVFFSILTIILQITAYYFLASTLIVLGISSLVSILCCHILLEKSLTYESCFIYTVLNVFISLIITILTFLGKDYSFTYIPYTSILIGISVINWFIPTLHCLIRYLFDYGIKIDDFLSYFRNNSILFLTFYIGVMVYSSFLSNAFPWAYTSNPEAANFTPFLVISTQIENFLYGNISLSDIIIYLSSRILIFIPYGFYCTLFLRRQSRLLRFFLLLLLPIILEILQYFLYPTRFDIDDVIYALIGGIFGSLIFYLINVLFLAVSGKEFLSKDTIYRFSNSSLHF